MQQKNTILFFVLSALILISWMVIMSYLQPPRPQKGQEPPAAGEQAKEPPKQPTPAMVVAGLVGQAAAPGLDAPIRAETAARVAVRSWPGLASRPQPVAKKPEPKPEAPKLPPQPLVTLGKDTDFVTAVIDPNRGAGVVRLTLPDFQAADSLGRPEWEDPAHKVKKPLDLLPAERNHDVPSFLLYDCEQGKDDQVRPYARLGEQPWQEDRSLRQTDPDGTVRRVAFWTDVQDVRVTKVYTLEPGDYHLGMEVRVARAPGVSPDKEAFFRYHLTSGHGLPIEGEWYTYTQRNAVVGLVDDKGNAERSLQYLQSIARMDGGNDVPGEGKGIQYGGVVTQYFASLVVVDGNPNTEGVFLRARPTVEARALKGTIQELPGGDTVRLLNKHDNKVYTVRVTPETILGGDLKPGEPVNVLAWSDPHDTLVARQLFAGQNADQLMFKATGHMLMFDDITVHMVTDRLDLKPGAGPLVQKYLLYNGPAKVQLLAYLEGSRKVAPALVERYSDKLHLNTVTDFHDPSTIGEIFYHTGGTWLVITITNLMHFILWVLHTYVMPWSWGLCILLLTVMVRGVMFPLSRKQALMSVRMQQLQPEIQKLKEKYKEDRQGLGLAQMELYRRHGVSPMGSCWTMFIQLPIFMGLYYALQQSILFRLAPFVWIPSLSAPDMLVNWGISIPVISDPAWREGSLLSFFYLGPFLNVLPVIVAGFMYVQQKLFTPPPADEQQEAQQKMMGFMTVIFGLMFYKLASGLCLYYIASSLWSLAERKFLPRRKPDENAPPPPARAGLMQRAMERLTALAQQGRPSENGAVVTRAEGTASPAAPPAVPERRPSGRRRGRKRRPPERQRPQDGTGRGPTPAANGHSADGQGGWTGTWRKLEALWQKILREARKR